MPFYNEVEWIIYIYIYIMLYKQRMIFYFNHFSLIIFCRSVWLGFELFGLRVQLVRLDSRSQRIWQITIVIINPRLEMGLDSGWRHSQKRWVEYLEDFEKDSVEFRPWCWEVGVRPWCWEVGVRPWCWEVGVRTWCREIEIGPCRQTIEFLPLGHREFSFSAIELSFLPFRRRSNFAGPEQRRWI